MNMLKFAGGLVSIIIGILLLRYFIKNPIPKERDTNKHMLQGYMSSFGFIILGLILIANELKAVFNYY